MFGIKLIIKPLAIDVIMVLILTPHVVNTLPINSVLAALKPNLGSVLTALQVQDYNLPDSIEKKTPIGSKVVFARWRGKDGKQYISVDMVYQTTEQLRPSKSKRIIFSYLLLPSFFLTDHIHMYLCKNPNKILPEKNLKMSTRVFFYQ